jgi:hypothetical protein
MTGTALEHRAPQLPAPITDREINRCWRVARALAMSRMFKDAMQAEQAFAKILMGRDLGLSPTQAMTGIHIVEGKPEVAAVTLAYFIRARDGYDFRVIEHTDEVCEIEFLVDGASRGTSRFTMAEATTAGLTRPSKNGTPSMYSKYARNMLWSRAMSNGAKWLVPEVLSGVPVYYEGEIDADDHEPPTEVAAGLVPDGAIDATASEAPADPEPPEAQVVPDEPEDPFVSDDDRVAVAAAFAAAGFDDMTMFLTAVGLESTDDLTESGKRKLSELLAEHLAKNGAAA